MNILISAKGQQLTKSEHPKVYADSIEYLKIKFDFDSDWNNTVKTAIITNGNSTYCIQLEDDTVTVPANCITYGDLWVSVFGVFGDMRITTGRVSIPIYKSGYTEGETPPEPKQDVYMQLLNALAAKADNLSYDGNTLSLKAGDEVLATVTVETSGEETVNLDDYITKDELLQSISTATLIVDPSLYKTTSTQYRFRVLNRPSAYDTDEYTLYDLISTRDNRVDFLKTESPNKNQSKAYINEDILYCNIPIRATGVTIRGGDIGNSVDIEGNVYIDGYVSITPPGANQYVYIAGGCKLEDSIGVELYESNATTFAHKNGTITFGENGYATVEYTRRSTSAASIKYTHGETIINSHEDGIKLDITAPMFRVIYPDTSNASSNVAIGTDNGWIKLRPQNSISGEDTLCSTSNVIAHTNMTLREGGTEICGNLTFFDSWSNCLKQYFPENVTQDEAMYVDGYSVQGHIIALKREIEALEKRIAVLEGTAADETSNADTTNEEAEV